MQPLAVYIHWPFCQSKCPYCDFNSHVRAHIAQADWKSALLSELGFFAEHLPDRKVESIFFGGGTPSLMEPATAGALIDAVCRHWPVDDALEITLEANPSSVETAHLAAFKTAGVNRVSLGVQAFHDADLKFLGRAHNAHEALKAIETAATLFERYSFDLMYARPHQTPIAWEKELGHALSYGSGHLSLYQLTIEPDTAFHAAWQKGELDVLGEEESATLFEMTQSMMEAAGMPAYEISNHARPGEESRHNLAYWRGHEYVGIGPGAHGRIYIKRGASEDSPPAAAPPSKGVVAAAPPAHNSGLHSTLTLKSPERWLEAVKKHGHGMESLTALTQEDIIAERIMMGLRLREGLALQDFEQQTGTKLEHAVNSSQLTRLITEGLLTRSTTHLTATPRGRMLLTAITHALLV